MNLQELNKRVADAVGCEPALAYGFVREAFDQLAAALDSGKSVSIRGLGRFHWRVFHRTTTMVGASRRTYDAGLKLRFCPSERLGRRRKKR